jgi:hypothetical protein
MMYRWIMLACSLWLAWPVPSGAKYRSAVNCANFSNILGSIASASLEETVSKAHVSELAVYP